MLKRLSMYLLFSVMALAILTGVTGCEEEMVAQNGDTVRVDYTGTLDDGTKFDTSAGLEPLEFVLGAGEMIPGFEAAVLGMKVGEYKKVVVPAAEAYGEPTDDLILTYPIEDIPEGLNPKVGDKLGLNTSTGTVAPAIVIEITDEYIKLDANSDLAGKDLTFEIELVEIIRE